MGSLFSSDIQIMAEIDGNYIAVRTYSRQRGRSRTGYIERGLVEKLLTGEIRRFDDGYASDHYSAWINGQNVVLTLDWLAECADGTLTGYRQCLNVPRSLFEVLLETGRGFKFLYIPREFRSRIDSSHAWKVIGEIQKNTRMRRAFIKAMRDRFHWQDDCIYLYADFVPGSFYFETSSGWPKNGGLILHESQHETPHGSFPKYIYQVHT